MNQPGKKLSKVAKVREDAMSLSEDEMKPPKVGKNKSSKSRVKKSQEKRRQKEKVSKDAKKSLVDSKYTDIKLSSYVCSTQSLAPRDAHIVEIDTFGVCCQLWEMYLAKTQTRNVMQKKAELYAIQCAALAILENIILGVRYSDIPTMVVEMFPRTRVCIRSDYVEVVHACSIPKGKVFIGRGNKSVGFLTAFIQTVDPTGITDNAHLNTLEANIVNLFTNKGFDSPLVVPPSGQDTCLDDVAKSHIGTKLQSDQLILSLRNTMLQANAAIADEADYQLYVPVLCEQSEICYVLNNTSDVQLITFMPIVNESTLRRLKIYALSFRFFLSYVRVMKENKALVDAESVENEMLEQGYVPIFGKHGIMMLTKRMDEEGNEEDQSVLVEENTSVPAEPKGKQFMTTVSFNFPSKDRKVCFDQFRHMSVQELSAFTGKRVQVSNDGFVAVETDQGITFTMLSNRQRSNGSHSNTCWFSKVPERPERLWSTWADASSGDMMRGWVNGLPSLPSDW